MVPKNLQKKIPQCWWKKIPQCWWKKIPQCWQKKNPLLLMEKNPEIFPSSLRHINGVKALLNTRQRKQTGYPYGISTNNQRIAFRETDTSRHHAVDQFRLPWSPRKSLHNGTEGFKSNLHYAEGRAYRVADEENFSLNWKCSSLPPGATGNWKFIVLPSPFQACALREIYCSLFLRSVWFDFKHWFKYLESSEMALGFFAVGQFTVRKNVSFG